MQSGCEVVNERMCVHNKCHDLLLSLHSPHHGQLSPHLELEQVVLLQQLGVPLLHLPGDRLLLPPLQAAPPATRPAAAQRAAVSPPPSSSSSGACIISAFYQPLSTFY